MTNEERGNLDFDSFCYPQQLIQFDAKVAAQLLSGKKIYCCSIRKLLVMGGWFFYKELKSVFAKVLCSGVPVIK